MLIVKRFNFNTTLVTVYQNNTYCLSGVFGFQYNSCYCLSILECGRKEKIELFQYNSCYCLSGKVLDVTRKVSFQYNSCYCLSEYCHLLLPAYQYFNTTLVTVYQELELILQNAKTLFQYNSCYCLSNVFTPFLVFIIVSFPDKINVSFIFYQPIVYLSKSAFKSPPDSHFKRFSDVF